MSRFQNGVSPTCALEEQPTIGLIGMGEMGKMYAKRLSEAGWKRINVCDIPKKYEMLKGEMNGLSGVHVLTDGHHVSRSADFIMYSVEAAFIDSVVAEYGPSTKVGAVVAGQTSVKAPECKAFESYLPDDVHIVSCHSLHGPTVSTVGQPLILIQHRAPDWALRLVEDILRPLGSRYVYMSYEDHDIVTANTQAVTHAAFLSMGTAWRSSSGHPWEGDSGLYVSGIEVAKVNVMLRIYANKWHVYAGLAILNPFARVQIDQYANSTTELFKLMLAGDKDTLRRRVYDARIKVFPHESTKRKEILLSEDLLDKFSLGKYPNGARPTRNSHLSLLAMVDCWATLGIDPFAHLELAATPIFRMWIGVAEYLFRSHERLDAAINAGVRDVSHRSDDLEFTLAARGWSQCISFGSFELYERRFQETAAFFEPRFKDATELGTRMLKAILQSTQIGAQ